METHVGPSLAGPAMPVRGRAGSAGGLAAVRLPPLTSESLSRHGARTTSQAGFVDDSLDGLLGETFALGPLDRSAFLSCRMVARGAMRFEEDQSADTPPCGRRHWAK
jgi:hypothetical protein